MNKIKMNKITTEKYLIFFVLSYVYLITNKSNKIQKVYKNILKNQFVKLFILIVLFNVITYDKNIGLMCTIIFLFTHNSLLNLTIDNNII